MVATIGGQEDGLKREFYCNQIVEPPHEAHFKVFDASGRPRDISVAEYFAREKRYR